MLQIRVWQMGPWWQVQVYDECACGQCAPDYIFDEQADNEMELHRLMKQAVIAFNKQIEWEKALINSN
jgi:hypothetical protein